MCIKSLGIAPGLANARPPGRAELANAPQQSGGGGAWPQLELTEMHYEQVFFFPSLSKPCQVVQMFGLNPWFYLRKCNCINGSNIYNKSGKSYLSSKHLIHVIQTIY